MRFVRITFPLILVLAAAGAIRAEDWTGGVAVDYSVTVRVELSPEKLKGDPLIIEGKVRTKPMGTITEIVPAIYETDTDGKKKLVAPEKRIVHPVQPVYEAYKSAMFFEGNLATKLRELAEKKATVDIVAERGKLGLSVTSITEVK